MRSAELGENEVVEDVRARLGLPGRAAPAASPLLFPGPLPVLVTDTNAVASRAWHAATCGKVEDLFTGLALTGRTPVFVAAHVPAELELRLPEATARFTEQGLRLAESVLWGQIMPVVPVVDLPIRDFLHPRIAPMMRADPDLPRRLHGDVDDLGTAALAEFLAPAIILSADSVFTRLGLANTLATTWLPLAYSLLHAAGFEVSLSVVVELLEMATRFVLAVGIEAGAGAVSLARRHPVPVLALVAALAFIVHKAGPPSIDRAWARQAGRTAGALLDAATEALDRHQKARTASLVVEPYGLPSFEQALARHLARSGRPLTCQELAAELTGFAPSVREVADALERHPAFVALPGGRYRIGSPVRRAHPG